MSKLKDDTLYCARCGISFLWTVEEQRHIADPDAQAIKPTMCPGCRNLLPAQGRERGLVKWYNARKRYGFIARAQEEDLFAHGSAVQGRGRLHPGDLVEFRLGTTTRGPAALDIQVLQAADAVEDE